MAATGTAQAQLTALAATQTALAQTTTAVPTTAVPTTAVPTTVVPTPTAPTATIPPATLTAAAQETGTALAATLTAFALTPVGAGPTNTPSFRPGLGITPSQGPPGTIVTITAPGASFQGSQAITLYFTDPLGNSAPQQIGSATSNYDGSLLVSNLALPAEATVGTATISAVAANGQTVTGTFTITPGIIANPLTVPPGGTTQVTGNGFAALNAIHLLLNGADVTASASPQPVTTDHLGHFVVTLTIPASQPLGLAVLQASDSFHQSQQLQLTIGAAVATGTTSPSVSPTASGVPATPTFLPTAPPLTFTPTPGAGGPPTGPSGTSGATHAYFAEGYTGSAKTNGKANFTETLSILNPGASAATVTITYYILGNRTPQVVTRLVPALSTVRESVNNDIGLDKQAAAVVTSPQRVYVVREITRTAPNGQRLDGSITAPATAPATSWTFAEGYTGVSFQEYLTLLNTNNAPASVTIRLAPQAASAAGARTLTLNVPPLSRSTANIRALTTGNSARSVGMLIASTQPVVAERVMYFGSGSGSGKFGSTVVSGLPPAAAQLRVGYGVSGGSTASGTGGAQPIGDQDYITIVNPSTGGSAAHVTASFNGANGAAIGKSASVDVAPGTRQTIIANTVLGAAAAGPFSVTLNATSGAVAAESAQYYGGSPNVGNHPGIDLAALPQPATDVFLADLSTRLPDGATVTRSVYLYNPNGAAEQVTATYYGSNGASVQKTYTVPPGGSTTVSVNQDTPSTFAGNPIGAQFKASGNGSFLAYAIGRTSDNLAAFAEVGTPAS